MSLRVAHELTAAICDAMDRAKRGPAGYLHVYRHEDRSEHRNQFCFFLKPGVTARRDALAMTKVLALVVDTINANRLRIDDVVVLGGPYLDRHQIMRQHYGTLDRLARDARAMSTEMRERFEQSYGVKVDEVDVVGGFEFLERHPSLSLFALDLLWANIAHERLGTGCFAGNVRVGNESVYVINGFTPHQLATYTEPTNATIVMSLSGNLHWREARHNFVGRSDPATARPGSLRNLFFVQRDALELHNVALAANGSHLSAGPLEAVVELRRLLSDHKCDEVLDLSSFQFGRKLLSQFSAAEVEGLMTNPVVDHGGERANLFELTEEVDEAEALELLTTIYKKD